VSRSARPTNLGQPNRLTQAGKAKASDMESKSVGQPRSYGAYTHSKLFVSDILTRCCWIRFPKESPKAKERRFPTADG